MATRVIRIKGSDPSTGNLDLSDHGHTPARAGDTIIWQIAQDSGVDSIISIQEKSGSANIWSTLPHPRGNNWTGDINSAAPAYAVYIYSITWAKGSNSYICDPIIAIKPSTINIKTIIFLVASVILAIFTVKFLRKNLNKDIKSR